MRRAGLSSVLLAVTVLSISCPGVWAAEEQRSGAWKQPVNVEIESIPLPSALQKIVKGTGISYIIDPTCDWRYVSASLQNTPVEEAVSQVLRVAGAPYRIEGNSVAVYPPGTTLPVRSVSAKIEAKVKFEPNDRAALGVLPMEYTVSVSNSGAEGSTIIFQNQAASPEAQCDAAPPVTLTLSAQLLPSVEQLQMSRPVTAISLSGNGGINMAVPYKESVSTVVGENVINQDVTRFVNASRNFSIGTSVPLGVPTVVSEGTETTNTGKLEYAVTVTLSLSKDDVVRRPVNNPGLPAMGGFGGGYGSAAPVSVTPEAKW